MKKIFALLLCVTMLLSLAPMVYAEDTSSGVSDSFETYDVGVISSYVTFRESSPVLSSNTYKGGTANQGIFEIVEDGFKGKGLKLSKTGTDYYQLGLIDVTNVSDENPVYVNFKIKILEDGYDGSTEASCQNMAINAGGTGSVYIKYNGGAPKMWPWKDTNMNNGVSSRFNYELNQWYDITVKYTADWMYSTVVDDKGNAGYGKIERRSGAGLTIASDKVIDSAIVVDEIYIIQGADYEVGVSEGSLPAEGESVSRLPELDFTLNAPANLDDMVVSVVDSEGASLPATAYTVTTKWNVGFSVKFNQVLGKGKDYTVTASGLKNIGGVSQENIVYDFTTEYARKLSAASKSAETVSDKTRVTINFDNAADYAATPVRAMAVIYDGGKMTSLEYVTATVDIYGTLVADFASVTPESDFSVLVFDDSNTLIPVSEAVCFE